MKKALEVLFGIKEPTNNILVNKKYTSYRVSNQPIMIDWFKELNISALTDKQSTNVPVRMGNNIKYVDLHSIKTC